MVRVFRYALIMLAILTLLSCGQGKYLVYTGTDTYQNLKKSGGSIDDGKYVQLPLSDMDYKNTNKGDMSSHYWAENDIYDYLVGRGFGDYEANRVVKYMRTEGHCIIISRTGSLVYCLLK